MARALVLGDDAMAAHHRRGLARHVPGLELVEASPGQARRALAAFLAAAAPEDLVVPHPLMPHLLWEWLAERLDARPAPPPRGWGLPFELERGGALYLSLAGWICPATCYEPPHCPALHAPRDWDLASLIEDRAAAERMHPAVFKVLAQPGGVAAVAAADLLAAASAPRGSEQVLVATSSHCHAAVGALTGLG